ncbi:hypothetical protein HAX54_028520 [Datura stramonium]|uniref:Uncharacterized protein n=1 Tax=Datura stramonium TaxID=4076 RepID=A0ABS8V5Q9_DATST|nr:hypothetical protein [Datura stramonium]
MRSNATTNVPVDTMSKPSSVVGESCFHSSVGLKEKIHTESITIDVLNQTFQTNPLDSVAIILDGMKSNKSFQGPGTVSVSSHKKEMVPENLMSKRLVDHLFEGDLPKERGKFSNVLAMSDQLVEQSLTKMALGESKIGVEDKVQPENVLGSKEEEAEKEMDDGIALGVILRSEKPISKSSTGGKTQKALSIQVKNGSKKGIFSGSKRKKREMPIDEEHDAPVESSTQR